MGETVQDFFHSSGPACGIAIKAQHAALVAFFQKFGQFFRAFAHRKKIHVVAFGTRRGEGDGIPAVVAHEAPEIPVVGKPH